MMKNKNKKGFSLIELLVVIGIFSGLMLLITGMFLANFELQRKTMAVQKTIGELSYAVEYMGRAIRMAKNDHEGTCLEEANAEGYTYGTPTEGNGIQFIDYKGQCIKFYLDASEGVIKKEIKEGGSWVHEYKLTSGLLGIDSFRTSTNVSPDGNGTLYEDQPSVTLFLKVAAKKGENTTKTWWKTRIQTTVTRRRLDIERVPNN